MVNNYACIFMQESHKASDTRGTQVQRKEWVWKVIDESFDPPLPLLMHIHSCNAYLCMRCITGMSSCMMMHSVHGLISRRVQ
jgi:hypothetical protein